MTARFIWKPRGILRRIDKQARETLDPIERLRYVRRQMDTEDPLKRSEPWPAGRILVATAAAIGAALLVWQFH